MHPDWTGAICMQPAQQHASPMRVLALPRLLSLSKLSFLSEIALRQMRQGCSEAPLTRRSPADQGLRQLARRHNGGIL
jgi:hypothetical protein